MTKLSDECLHCNSLKFAGVTFGFQLMLDANNKEQILEKDWWLLLPANIAQRSFT